MTLLITISNEEYTRIMAMDWKNTIGCDKVLTAIHDSVKIGHSLQEIQKALDILDNNHIKLVNYDYEHEELGAAQTVAIDILQQIEEMGVNA